MTIAKTTLRAALAVTVMAGGLSLAPVAGAGDSGHGQGQGGMQGSGHGMMQGGMDPQQMREMMQTMSPEQRRRFMRSMQGRGSGMMGQSGGMTRGQMGPGTMRGMGTMGHAGMMGHPGMTPARKGLGMMGRSGAMPGPMTPGMMGGTGMMRPAMMARLGEKERTELLEMRQEMRRSQMEAMLDIMAARDELRAAMGADRPDPGKVRELHDRIAERHGDALETRIEMRNKMRDFMQSIRPDGGNSGQQ